MYIVVSSANKIDFAPFKLSGRSFVYIINSKGPNTDPCGTPHSIRSLSFNFCSEHIVFCQSSNFCTNPKLCL